MSDLQFTNHGTIVLCEPLTNEANDWIADNVWLDDAQYWGKAIAMEPRYARDICQAAILDGLKVE